MASKMDKETLKAPDVFISTSDKIFNFVEKHLAIFLAGVAVIALASITYVTINFVHNHEEVKAAEALYGPEAELKKAQADFKEKQADKMKAAMAAVKGKKAPALPDEKPDYDKDFKAHVETLEAAIKANGGTKASLVSALNLSYFLAQQEQYAEALKVLDLPRMEPRGSDLLGGFWLMHRGVMQVENKQYDPAIKTYQTVLAAESLKPFYPEALLKLGLCFELKGDAQKARETYERIGREYPETEASSYAQQYLRLLEMKSSQKG